MGLNPHSSRAGLPSPRERASGRNSRAYSQSVPDSQRSDFIDHGFQGRQVSSTGETAADVPLGVNENVTGQKVSIETPADRAGGINKTGYLMPFLSATCRTWARIVV